MPDARLKMPKYIHWSMMKICRFMQTHQISWNELGRRIGHKDGDRVRRLATSKIGPDVKLLKRVYFVCGFNLLSADVQKIKRDSIRLTQVQQKLHPLFRRLFEILQYKEISINNASLAAGYNATHLRGNLRRGTISIDVLEKYYNVVGLTLVHRTAVQIDQEITPADYSRERAERHKAQCEGMGETDV